MLTHRSWAADGFPHDETAGLATRRSIRFYTTGITSAPPIYGRSASGIRTEPSGCWCVSRIATTQRVVARVPLRVATARCAPYAHCPYRPRCLRCVRVCSGGVPGRWCSSRSRSARGRCPGWGPTPHSRICVRQRFPGPLRRYQSRDTQGRIFATFLLRGRALCSCISSACSTWQ